MPDSITLFSTKLEHSTSTSTSNYPSCGGPPFSLCHPTSTSPPQATVHFASLDALPNPNLAKLPRFSTLTMFWHNSEED